MCLEDSSAMDSPRRLNSACPAHLGPRGYLEGRGFLGTCRPPPQPKATPTSTTTHPSRHQHRSPFRNRRRLTLRNPPVQRVKIPFSRFTTQSNCKQQRLYPINFLPTPLGRQTHSRWNRHQGDSEPKEDRLHSPPFSLEARPRRSFNSL